MPHKYGSYSRFLAWFMARSDGRYRVFVEARKRDLLQGLTGILLEIGPGAGANLRYLSPDLHLVGVEPNPFMHPHLRREAKARRRSMDLVRGVAESLPFPDSSIDAVLATLVLCSVENRDGALSEILRVLKPGGKFIFIEHVAAAEGTWLRRVQRFIRPAWRLIGDGCEPDRTMDGTLFDAGFRAVTLHRFAVPLPIVSPHVAGIAEKKMGKELR